jgi:hypothetical protein
VGVKRWPTAPVGFFCVRRIYKNETKITGSSLDRPVEGKNGFAVTSIRCKNQIPMDLPSVTKLFYIRLISSI